ncbi:MAG TPA: branched-chain amino acid ABC transporter permease [Acidimicrobiia bacterium]|nr:branched-chain amino acid ABC transporter permease [Acidimicrobiia bacterium]
MSRLVQQLVNGTVLGATIGLIALGYTMVYGIIQLINFAHGEIFMVGSYAGLALYTYALPDSWTRHAVITLPLVMLAAAVAAAVVAVLAERLAYRPLRNAPRLAPLITAIGVSIGLQEAVRLFYPGGKNTLPFPGIISRGAFSVAGVTIAWTSVFTVVVAALSMVALDLFVNGTRLGKAMRATSQDPQTAQLMGIDTDKVIVVAFALGGALAGVAGVIQGIRFVALDFHIGFIAGIKAFTAAVLGGIGNIRGAMLGGLVIGLVEALATEYVPHGGQWKDVWAFVVLILVLTLRPEGFLGEEVAVRA